MKQELSINFDDIRTVINNGGNVTFKPIRGGKDRYICNQLPKLGKLNKTQLHIVRKKISDMIRQSNTPVNRHGARF